MAQSAIHLKNLMITETLTNSNERNNPPMMTTFGFKTRFMIGTWNVRTLSEISRLEQLQKEMSIYKLDILGVSEARWLGNGSKKTMQGYTFIYAGNATRRSNGVGLLMSPKASSALIEHRTISDRLIVARFKSKFRNFSVIQCYAPTEPDEDDAKDDFYLQLDSVTRSLPGADIKIILGDFNAKVGCENTNLEAIMGKHGLGCIRNSNGDRLVDFCASNRFFIGGTKFPHKDIHKYTWESPDGHSRNQIDHVLINKLFLGSLMDVKARRGADMDSDHNLLVATFRFRPAAIISNCRKVEKYNTTLLHDPAVTDSYNRSLRDHLSSTNPNNWSNITEACKASAKAVLGTKTNKIKPWISPTAWERIQNRKQLRKEILRTKNHAKKAQIKTDYRQCSRQVTYTVRADRENYFNNIAEQVEQASNTGNLRSVYTAIKQMSGNNVRGTSILKAANGAELTTSNEQLKRWREFFLSQSSPDNNEEMADDHTNSRRNPRRDIITSPPTLEEVTAVLENMKNCKSAGPDNIPAELFKYGSSTIPEFITPFIRNAWINNQIPSEWKDGVIITIPKKGDLSICKNWRGITLLNSIGKVMASLILQRIKPALEEILRKEQAGFRPGRSCADHVNTLRIIIEQSVEYNSHLYLVFVDFERAFDTVNRNSIWKILEKKGIPQKIIDLIRELYTDAQYRVRFNGKESSAFNTFTGVRQGCVLSPTLFLLLLDSVMEETNREAPFGIRWNMHEYLYDIDYADDICLMSHRLTDAEGKLKRLSENAKKVGLRINFNKTKLMRIGTQTVAPLIIDGNIIEDVDEFTYLGCKITKNGGSTEDIIERINKARVAFLNLHKVWRSNNITKKTKLRIFNCSVMSVLLYGCTTWSFTKSTQRKLQAFINRCLRHILKIYWPNRISNENLWQEAKCNAVNVEILRRKWTWIGHILRRPISEISRAALEWNPQGQRHPGRPRSSWKRCIKSEHEAVGLSWSQVKSLARDRRRWREFVNALCST